MIDLYSILLPLIISYLIGAIPASVWIGKIFFNVDIRNHGSGNAGATNVMRVFGTAVGIPVLIFDIFKGFFAVKMLAFFPFFIEGSTEFVNMQVAMGIAAVIGHIYPVYVGFKGGKGVAAVFGVLLALSPLATICAAGVFIIVFLIGKYVSVASITAGLFFPVLIILVFKTPFLTLRIFSVFVALLIVFTHRKNISRLLQGTENRATFIFKNIKKKLPK